MTPVADTDTGADTPAEGSVHGPLEKKPKKSRAGRNLPVAILVGVAISGAMIAILICDKFLWVPLVAAAIPIATHEVVRRLREAGFVIPVVPLLIGGQTIVWLTWPYGPRGALAGFGGFFRAVVLPFGEWNAAFLGDYADGFREACVLYLADKAEDIAGLAAAEAVVAIFIHVEAGCFLAVERAAAFPLLARSRQPHTPSDHRRQRGAGPNLVQEAGGKGHSFGRCRDQADRWALTIGPALAMSRLAACFPFSTAMTLPMSLMLAAPVSATASATARRDSVKRV